MKDGKQVPVCQGLSLLTYSNALCILIKWLFMKDFKTPPNIPRSKKILAIFFAFVINSSFTSFWPMQRERSHAVPVSVIRLYGERDPQFTHDTPLPVLTCHMWNCRAHFPAKSFAVNTARTRIFFCKKQKLSLKPWLPARWVQKPSFHQPGHSSVQVLTPQQKPAAVPLETSLLVPGAGGFGKQLRVRTDAFLCHCTAQALTCKASCTKQIPCKAFILLLGFLMHLLPYSTSDRGT